jgi:putative Mn2+ efflux pump MntP
MLTVLLLALALSADAFAAAVCQGAAAEPRPTAGGALRIGSAFGSAQALMPLLGWGLGVAFAGWIAQVDHWVAFVLLAVLGGRMVHAGLTGEPDCRGGPLMTGWPLFAAAVATSIDAAAAGVTLPMLSLPVMLACATIGVVTFAISAGGVLLGRMAGSALGPKAEVVGGVVLIGLGVKILVEHRAFG